MRATIPKNRMRIADAQGERFTPAHCPASHDYDTEKQPRNQEMLKIFQFSSQSNIAVHFAYDEIAIVQTQQLNGKLRAKAAGKLGPNINFSENTSSRSSEIARHGEGINSNLLVPALQRRAASGHSLPCRRGTGMVRCAPDSGPRDSRALIDASAPRAAVSAAALYQPLTRLLGFF